MNSLEQEMLKSAIRIQILTAIVASDKAMSKKITREQELQVREDVVNNILDMVLNAKGD